MDSELGGKVLKRKEAMRVIKTSLILCIAFLHLTVVSWHIRANELMVDAETLCGELKASRYILLGITVGEVKAVVVLFTLDRKFLGRRYRLAICQMSSSFSGDGCNLGFSNDPTASAAPNPGFYAAHSTSGVCLLGHSVPVFFLEVDI